MINEAKILKSIYTFLYKRDVDSTLNIFLCGLETGKSDSIRKLLNNELQKNAKVNVVYPEYIFANLFGKGKSNLFELEDELAKYVDIIIIPLEGMGTLCELGAFVMNKDLFPKIIAINDVKFKNTKSFINLGPIDLIKRKNSKNLFFYQKGKESQMIASLIERIKYKRFDKRSTYGFENIFNLSRYVLYLIAVFQPVTREKIEKLVSLSIDNGEKVTSRHIESSIQILLQKNRIESNVEQESLKTIYSLSKIGHDYFYQELIVKLQVKQHFTILRAEIINSQNKRFKRDMSKDLKLLV